MKNQGFSLLELLVAISILALLLGLGIVNYIGYQERQALLQAAQLVREVMADAQNSARSGKLRGCEVLSSYQVSIANEDDSGVIEVSPYCYAGSAAADATRTFILPRRVLFSQPLELYVLALSGLIASTPDGYDGSGAETVLPSGSLETIVVESGTRQVEVEVSGTGVVALGEVEIRQPIQPTEPPPPSPVVTLNISKPVPGPSYNPF